VPVRNCKHCAEEFTIPADFVGRHRSHCSPACRRKHQLALRAERDSKGPVCSVDGCTRQVTGYKGLGLCSTCYVRMYRGGQADLPKRKGRYQTGNGYLVLLRPEHPLARKASGMVMEHRLVLYNAIGPGPHACQWCGTSTEWCDAHVDHLDGNKRNNTLENLLFSCATCNKGRGIALEFIDRLTVDGRRRFEACLTGATTGYRQILTGYLLQTIQGPSRNARHFQYFEGEAVKHG